jgi:hypothetical protein
MSLSPATTEWILVLRWPLVILGAAESGTRTCWRTNWQRAFQNAADDGVQNEKSAKAISA